MVYRMGEKVLYVRTCFRERLRIGLFTPHTTAFHLRAGLIAARPAAIVHAAASAVALRRIAAAYTLTVMLGLPISMARSNAPDSASSQFFITVADATFLDGSYAAFGRVTEGMEIAEKIAKDAKPVDNNGTIPPDQQPVIERIVITD